MAALGRCGSCIFVHKYNYFLRPFVYRTLLSDSDTKLEGYLRQRIFKTDELGPSRRALMMCKLKEVKTPRDAMNAAFGIVDLIHVAEEEEELSELERLFRLISLHKLTDAEFFSFGSSLLRLYHHLGLPDRAYRLYKDPVCNVLLKDNTCHKTLMDLLFKHEQYERVLDIYSGLQTFNIDCVTMALGSHYHINTPKSAGAAQKLVQDLMQQNSLSRRALFYAAVLSMNQNQPDIALEILKMCRENNLGFNIMLMCHAKLGQIQDVLTCLGQAANKANDIRSPLQVRLYSDTMREVRQTMANCDNQSNKRKFSHLEQELSSLAVFSQQTVTVLLNKTIYGDRNNLKESGKRKIKRVEQ